eukprot:g6259.t1
MRAAMCLEADVRFHGDSVLPSSLAFTSVAFKTACCIKLGRCCLQSRVQLSFETRTLAPCTLMRGRWCLLNAWAKSGIDYLKTFSKEHHHKMQVASRRR